MLRPNGEAPGQEVRRTPGRGHRTAPDAASDQAFGPADPNAWSGAGRDAAGVLWGLCGQGGAPGVRVVVDTAAEAAWCACAAAEPPCGHVRGLLLLGSAGPSALPRSTAPGWVAERLGEGLGALDDGRAGGACPAGAPAGGSGRTAEREARRRAERRAARITAGASELEQRLADLLHEGLASAERSGGVLREEAAARMVDAQAPGLAARVRELGDLPGSGPDWPVRLLEECALLHLLNRAWLGRDRLPGPLAATVRTRVGLPSAADGTPVADSWLVLSQQDASAGGLTTRRIWLHGRESGRAVLLLSFGAAGRSPGLSLPVGRVLRAEVTPHGGSGGLRGELTEPHGPPTAAGRPPPGGTSCAGAAAAYGRALVDDPWAESRPVILGPVVPLPVGDGWQLADGEGADALPITPAAAAGPGLWRLVALAGGRAVTVFGELGHRGFVPLAAWTDRSAEVVTLT
ncbi:SWIM zinc finger family protein [Streptomyces sp. C10-9-1]|uniref:SWIM zinc finger family protein n=1 Tax=Streptomyces sp. C10-9-1 TaxID=1859285 RepID=UPI002112B149|nr:SWIM zinc finger family protein [Streptomyces sp. C10-9-1]MCQ6555277.1 SWIM zinc finger family protein [Streptomyces sp. C10-9-1]